MKEKILNNKNKIFRILTGIILIVVGGVTVYYGMYISSLLAIAVLCFISGILQFIAHKKKMLYLVSAAVLVIAGIYNIILKGGLNLFIIFSFITAFFNVWFFKEK